MRAAAAECKHCHSSVPCLLLFIYLYFGMCPFATGRQETYSFLVEWKFGVVRLDDIKIDLQTAIQARLGCFLCKHTHINLFHNL